MSGRPAQAGLILRGSYPNPFNPRTTIAFALSRAGRARIDVFDNAGHFIQTLENRHYTSGDHTLELNAEGLASGVYLVRVQAHGTSVATKVVLLK